MVNKNTPAQRPFDASVLQQLRVPSGFSVSVFATGLVDPRMIEVGPDGTVYVTRWHSDDVLALRDTNSDGRADTMRTVATDLDGVHGLDLHDGNLYLASPSDHLDPASPSDGSSGEENRQCNPPCPSEKTVQQQPRVIVDDLPDGGQHENRVLQFGPDGLLYVSVGSSCNDCAEANQLERATIMRFTADGHEREIVANGLRNTIGFDWHPVTNELWGMDNGSDFHGDNVPPEELNRILPGANYGWPICYGERVVDPLTTDSPRLMALRPGQSEPILRPITRQEYCAQTEPSVLTYQAHTAPLWMQFYEGTQFPAEYRNDAFVVFRGSWNRAEPVGYKVVRLRFASGTPMAFEDFLTGFLHADRTAFFARPAGLAIAQDGSLLVSDDTNGVIYRVSYQR